MVSRKRLEQLSNELLHYGRCTSDIEFEEVYDGFVLRSRVRTFFYNGNHFYHLMVNGKCIECYQLV